ncbi:hypothetical protein ACRYCC_05895 [Actinomadura scrupuli]|uniref:hypothetical protein n=1 Tax=Actinomadura scrupuli TaxID=559629 RepID=UPI003D98DDF4
MSAAAARGAASGVTRALAALGASAFFAEIATAYLALFGTPEPGRALPYPPGRPPEPFPFPDPRREHR